MLTKLADWLDERTGIKGIWRWVADEPVPGGARLRYVFGSVLMYLFAQQVVLGILLASYYSPSATDAWASTAYLNDRVTAGWFLRGLHHHGSSAMVIVTALHFGQVFLAGAYRKPRELNWLTGLAMGGIVFAFALTGYLLPWDQKGYWATQVATSIMGTVPGGSHVQVLLQGGHEYGNLTLTRFYTLHVFVLPIGLAGLLAAHLFLFRKHGVTPPPLSEKELTEKEQTFFPHQLFLDVAAMALVGALLVVATWKTHGAELFAPAQPASNFVARPEWYFLFLFELLKYFEGPLQIIATVILPGAATTFLVALPWLDKAESRRARDRMPLVVGVSLLMAGVVALTGRALAEDRRNEAYQKGLIAAHEEARLARELAKKGVLPPGGDAVFENDPQFRARSLFREHCANCHAVGGNGGDEAPDFRGYSSREWLRALIRNPESPRFFGGTKHAVEMEAYPEQKVSNAQLDAVVEYVTSLMGPEAGDFDAALATKGKALFDELDCSTCHDMEPGGTGDGPNLHGHGTRAWVARVISDSSQKDLFGENAKMPKFARKLPKEDIELLAGWIVSLRAAAGP